MVQYEGKDGGTDFWTLASHADFSWNKLTPIPVKVTLVTCPWRIWLYGRMVASRDTYSRDYNLLKVLEILTVIYFYSKTLKFGKKLFLAILIVFRRERKAKNMAGEQIWVLIKISVCSWNKMVFASQGEKGCSWRSLYVRRFNLS